MFPMCQFSDKTSMNCINKKDINTTVELSAKIKRNLKIYNEKKKKKTLKYTKISLLMLFSLSVQIKGMNKGRGTKSGEGTSW